MVAMDRARGGERQYLSNKLVCKRWLTHLISQMDSSLCETKSSSYKQIHQGHSCIQYEASKQLANWAKLLAIPFSITETKKCLLH